MSKLKKLGAVLLCLCLTAALAVPCFAAEEYTYTITLYSGNQGVFASTGTDTITLTAKLGDRINFNVTGSAVNLNSEKYYIKGVRLSGREDTEPYLSTTVTGDQMYVVAYGIKGEMTSYTVTYTDSAGTALFPSQTFYGNVGDKPVVAFMYVDGYQPQAYNLTKTLSANAAENTFNFVYQANVTEAPTPSPSPSPETTAAGTEAAPETEEETVPAAPVTEENPETAENPTEPAEETEEPVTIIPDNQPPAAAGTEAEDAAPADDGADTDGAADGNAPEEIMDLDVPLAEPEEAEAEDGGISAPVVAGAACGGAAVLVVLGLLLYRRKRNKTRSAR